MKNLTLLLAAIFFLISTSNAQEDKKSKEILDAIGAKTKAYTTIKSDFDFIMENKVDKTSNKQQGSIILKGDKFRLTIEGLLVISDGKTVWNYIEESDEVQISEPEEDDMVSPSNILTIWEKNFKHKYIKEETENGVVLQVIDLVPIQGGKPYFKIRLYIDYNKKQLVKASIHEKEGNVNTYIIKTFVVNESIADSKFTFNVKDYPNVDVIDLR